MTMQEKWYAVYTCPNSEKKIYNELSRRAITAFLPIRYVVRQWSDRKKKVEIPLFPNYVFVRVLPREMMRVKMVNGVVRFVLFDGAPVAVKDNEIDYIKKLIYGAAEINHEDSFVKGEKVQVIQGPLAGLVGWVNGSKRVTRLYIELESIHRVLSVDIDVANLQKVN